MTSLADVCDFSHQCTNILCRENLGTPESGKGCFFFFVFIVVKFIFTCEQTVYTLSSQQTQYLVVILIVGDVPKLRRWVL
jgi:hypothetical protein